VDWTDLAHDRDKWQDPVDKIMKFQLSQNAENFMTSLVTAGFSKETLLHGVSNI
jgi:hypothetical protein